jgi:hypothetical protein
MPRYLAQIASYRPLIFQMSYLPNQIDIRLKVILGPFFQSNLSAHFCEITAAFATSVVEHMRAQTSPARTTNISELRLLTRKLAPNRATPHRLPARRLAGRAGVGHRPARLGLHGPRPGRRHLLSRRQARPASRCAAAAAAPEPVRRAHMAASAPLARDAFSLGG